MTAPGPRAGRADTTQLLVEIRDAVIAWRRARNDNDRRNAGVLIATGDGLASRFAALDEALAAASAYLPAQWAQATADAAPLPTDAAPPLAAAAADVEAALASYHAAEAAKTKAVTGLDAAGKALGDARLRFLDLARRADLERP